MAEINPNDIAVTRLCRKEQIHIILKKQFMIKYGIDIFNDAFISINKRTYKIELKELKFILKWFRINKKVMIDLKFEFEWKKHYLPKIQKIMSIK
jgi:hypothetical protein